MSKPEYALLDKVNDILFSIEKRIRPRLEKVFIQKHITPPEGYILQSLHKEGATRITHLAERMNVKPSAISIVIDQLMNKGYVQRFPSAVDGRVVMTDLTEEGKVKLKEIEIEIVEILAKHFSHFTETELDIFLQLLNKFERVAVSMEN